jgi:hypothetical protein
LIVCHRLKGVTDGGDSVRHFCFIKNRNDSDSISTPLGVGGKGQVNVINSEPENPPCSIRAILFLSTATRPMDS